MNDFSDLNPLQQAAAATLPVGLNSALSKREYIHTDKQDTNATHPTSHNPNNRQPPTHTIPRKRIKPDLALHTPRSQIGNARNAFLFAEDQHTPLNLFLTVDYRDHRLWEAGIRNATLKAAQIAKVREAIRHALGDFCRRYRFPFRWVAALENVRGHGVHEHRLMHIPTDRWDELIPRLQAFLCKAMGCTAEYVTKQQAKQAAAGIQEDGKLVRIPFKLSNPDKPLNRFDQLNELAYLSGTVCPEEEIEVGGQPQMLANFPDSVTLKSGADPMTRRRLTTADCIGPKARSKAGWQELPDDLEWLHRQLRRRQEGERIAEAASKRAKAREAATTATPLTLPATAPICLTELREGVAETLSRNTTEITDFMPEWEALSRALDAALMGGDT